MAYDFQTSSKGGGGVIFNPKIYVADFGNFKQGFLRMKFMYMSNFRVQGMFFQQSFWEKSNKTHFKEGNSESPPHPPFGTFPKIWRRPPSLTEPYPTLEVIKSSVKWHLLSLIAWNPNKLMRCLFTKLFLGTVHTPVHWNVLVPLSPNFGQKCPPKSA